MATKIKVLKTNGVNGLVVHELRQKGVTDIRDNSIDASQNFVLQYLVYVDKQLKYSYENGVYEVEYYEE